ncbi:MAG: hypothetical protein IT425_00220 [Pirellulales bacterium]|nr:hypothetical protein [Pirellulales bacterium]
MKRLHPNAILTTRCAFMVCLLVAGCQSTSVNSTGNPFLAPSRVPPPSTRSLAPGQAQPYYQGDPLPVMQTSSQPSPSTPLNSSTASTLSASGRSLQWGNNVPAATTATWPAAAAAHSPLIASGTDSPVAVPTDTQELRFPLPTTPPADSLAATATPTNAGVQPIETLPATAEVSQSDPSHVSATHTGIALASYTSAPMNAMALPPQPGAIPNSPPPVESPWRSPSLAATAPPPGYLVPPASSGANMQVAALPATQPSLFAGAAPTAPQPPFVPIALPSNPMAVQLRAVPSPSPQPGDPAPRVRFPTYDVPQSANDGFRPRSTMR